MPTYEYRCTSCKHEFEKFQRMSEEPGAACPKCGAPAERLLSGGAGLLFKGSGFYITDYRNDSYRKAAKSDSGESKADSGKGEKPAAESKPAPSKPAGGSKPAAPGD